MISVIIPTYRNPAYLDICLDSIEKTTGDITNVEVIVIVDGFIDESLDVLKKYPWAHVLDLEENRGMATAINLGAINATHEYVFVINDDNVFCHHWDIVLETFIRTREPTDKWVAAIDQVEPHGPSVFNFDIKSFGDTATTFHMPAWLDYQSRLFKKEPTEHIGWIFPFLIAKRYYLAVGGLDGEYRSPNFCDWDFFLKLQLLGFSTHTIHNARLYHFGSVVTKKNAEAPKFTAQQQYAYNYYHYKWGITPVNISPTNSKVPLHNTFKGFTV